MDRLTSAVAKAARDRVSVDRMLRDVHRVVRDWAGGLSDDVAALALKRQPS
jgi:hypothetical protein